MTQDRKPQPESSTAASTGGQSGDRHWQHRESPSLDPVQYKRWCDDRLVQMMAEPIGGDTSAAVHASAQQGIAEPGGPLPHLAQIQESFGPGHDVAHVQAHVGGAAAAASEQIGAQAYATGDHVAFAAAPDLHLAAHEAAHTVQQRAGVQLSGGVGDAGDVYEHNADEVADRVVAGESAADLLPGGRGDDELEADEGEEAGATNRPLQAGKPSGAVQKKAGGKPATAARRARALTIQQATTRYAPLVFLAPGEENGPSDASAYIDNSRLRWSHDSGRTDHQLADQGDIDEDRLGDGGYQHQVEGRFSGHHGDPIHSDDDARPKDGAGDGGNEGFFLDLDNSKRGALGKNDNAPVYHEAVDKRFITYWFFYAYNSGPTSTTFDNHEGDWERIVVKLDGRNRATHVAYYQHNGPPETKPWKDVPKDGSHPIVYSAKGSHASYASPGKKDLHLGGVNVPGVKDTAGRGKQWKTWNNLKSAKAQGWYGYGGAWGEVGNTKDTTGPQGPSRHKPPAPKGW